MAVGPKIFQDQIDEYRKWFMRLYSPRYELRVHYKYNPTDKEHVYTFEIDGAMKKAMPWSVPAMWFEDPIALAVLKEEFLSRMQQRTFQVMK